MHPSPSSLSERLDASSSSTLPYLTSLVITWESLFRVGIWCLAIEEVVQDVVELYCSCSVYLLVSTGPVVIGRDINEQDLLLHASIVKELHLGCHPIFLH